MIFMVKENITIEGARIVFRNFSGKEGRFNPPGKKNFCVLLDNELASNLKDDGWNVKWLKPREEDDEPQAYIQVSVNFDTIPPKIVLVTSSGKQVLDDKTVSILDWAEIANVDIIIRPYNWEMADGMKGVKAYVKSMYVTIVEDEFEKKYSNVPDSAINTLPEDNE